MFGDQNLQHYSHGMDETDRPGTGEIGRLSRRLLDDVRELGSVAFVEGRRGSRRGWSTLKAAVRAGPMRAAVVALGLGAVLGYALARW